MDGYALALLLLNATRFFRVELDESLFCGISYFKCKDIRTPRKSYYPAVK